MATKHNFTQVTTFTP